MYTISKSKKKQSSEQTNQCARRISQRGKKCRDKIMKNCIPNLVIATPIKPLFTPHKNANQTKNNYEKDSEQYCKKRAQNST